MTKTVYVVRFIGYNSGAWCYFAEPAYPYAPATNIKDAKTFESVTDAIAAVALQGYEQASAGRLTKPFAELLKSRQTQIVRLDRVDTLTVLA